MDPHQQEEAPMLRHGRTLGAGAFVALALTAGPAFGVGQPPVALETGGTVVSPDGAVRYTLHHRNLKTSVTAVRVRDGRQLGRTSLQGMWGVAPLTVGTQYGGVSHDGSRLVVAQVGSGAANGTRFAVVPTDFRTPPRFVSLAGDFAFDALSPDNKRLYVIERAGTSSSPFSYRVRLFDLPAGKLQPGVVAATETPEPMAGLPLWRAETANGRWAYTLYTKTNGLTFVHALDTMTARAWCIDLPWKAGQPAWGLRLQLNEGRHALLVRHGTRTVATIATRGLKVTSAAPTP
jgi:hypothetical protein